MSYNFTYFSGAESRNELGGIMSLPSEVSSLALIADRHVGSDLRLVVEG